MSVTNISTNYVPVRLALSYPDLVPDSWGFKPAYAQRKLIKLHPLAAAYIQQTRFPIPTDVWWVGLWEVVEKAKELNTAYIESYPLHY